MRTSPRPEMAMPRRRWRGAGTNRPRRGVSGTVAFGSLGLRLRQTISERGSIVRTGTLGNLRKKLPAPSSSVAAAADPAPPLAVASDETGGEGAVGVRLHRAGSVRDQRTAHSVLPKLSCPLSTIAESSKSAAGGAGGRGCGPAAAGAAEAILRRGDGGGVARAAALPAACTGRSRQRRGAGGSVTMMH